MTILYYFLGFTFWASSVAFSSALLVNQENAKQKEGVKKYTEVTFQQITQDHMSSLGGKEGSSSLYKDNTQGTQENSGNGAVVNNALPVASEKTQKVNTQKTWFNDDDDDDEDDDD